MPKVLVISKDLSLINLLKKSRKQGYELVPTSTENVLQILDKERDEIHALVADADMISADWVMEIKQFVREKTFPVILIAGEMEESETARWIGCGVSEILQLSMQPILLSRRIGSAIQLYCTTRSLENQSTDHLTGLYNRGAFYHYAKEMIRKDPDACYAIILSDIEYFKRINERFGEAKGDALLQYVGHVLGSLNGDGVLFARYGGDQFVGIMKRPDTFVEFDMNHFQAQMQEFYQRAPIEHFNVQFGFYDDVDTTIPVSIMCDRALMALKTIKHQYGRFFASYTLQLQQKFNREQQILDSMEQAISEHQFKVYYQPKHDARTSEVIGAEALVRWNHPVYGFMSPAEFIPLFESSGFISKLDEYVWKQVCLDVKHMMQKGFQVVPVSVNASRKDLVTERIMQAVKSPVEQLNLDPALLHIELTESIYMEDAEILAPLMKRLKDLGFKLELDDFGSGYSSLGILSKLPVDIIKLDISLISQIETQPAIVQSMIQLLHTLGYEVTAEGVENDRQVDMLRKMGCDYNQGYYYSRPLTFDGFCEYMLQ